MTSHRSPIAEAVFGKLVTDENVSDKGRIDSTATSTCEVGNPPDDGGRNRVKKHIARQVPEDFVTFDYMPCTEESNRRDVTRKGHRSRATIELLGATTLRNSSLLKTLLRE